MQPHYLEIGARTLARLGQHGAGLVAMGAVFAALCAWWLHRRSPWPARVLLGGAVVWGVATVWSRLSLVDDAFISFRYAHNLLAGHGLVFNPGERVQGYTNFGWTVLLAAVSGVTTLSIPHAALICGVAAWAALVATVAWIGRSLQGGRWFPSASAMVCLSPLMASFASTGLETGLAALLALLGGWGVSSRRDPRGTALAGLAFTLATLTRPDHALFQLAGGLVVLAEVRQTGAWRLVAFCAPFALWVAWAAWAHDFYGAVLPNTFHVRSVTTFNGARGVAWLYGFALADHYWLLGLVALAWARLPAGLTERAFRRYTALSTLLCCLWIVQVGGDFMYGRFMVPVVPLVLLATERVLHHAAAQDPRRGVVVAGILGLGAVAVPLIRPGVVEWHVSDEPTIYPVVHVAPLEVRHHSFALARLLRTALTERDLHPVVATWGVGMVAFTSELEVIDIAGLTDAHVAHMPIRKRKRPGHEKFATIGYLMKRGVHLSTLPHDTRFVDMTRLWRTGEPGHGIETWHILRYEEGLMRAIATRAPEIGFTAFLPWLRQYVDDLPKRSPQQVRVDLAFFDAYYFDHNPDSEGLRAQLEAFAETPTSPDHRPGAPPEP